MKSVLTNMRCNSMNKYKDEMLETLSDLIKIPSFKTEAKADAPFGEGPKAALIRFIEIADDLGFRTFNVDNYAGYAEFGPEDESIPMIGIITHLDVVPADGWADAYKPIIGDDIIIGRGSIDDKGPTVSVLYALKSLMDEGYEPKTRIRLIVGTDEENGSECMQYYVKHAEVPVAAFTADFEFPVVNGEKGRVKFDLVWKDMDKRPQAGEYRLVSGESGHTANIVPGEAKLTFQDEYGNLEEVITQGESGHASTPELYKNAAQYALMDAKARLDEKGVQDPFLEDFSNLLNTEFNGEGLRIPFSDEPSGPLTVNLGIFRLDENEARLTLDIRYPVTFRTEKILANADIATIRTGFTIENFSDSPALYRPESDPLVSLLTDAYNSVTGDNAKPISIGGGTYARHVPNTLCFGANFPGTKYLGHADYEFASIPDIVKSSEVYKVAIVKMDEYYSK